MNEISKDDNEHLKKINTAIRNANINELSAVMDGNSYPQDYLRKSYMQACANGDVAIVSFFMTSKTFTPNQLSVRGVESLFANKRESVINWLIFEYNVKKSGAIEEVLIELTDREYAKHIEQLFEKRALLKKLESQLPNKEEEPKETSHKTKI